MIGVWFMKGYDLIGLQNGGMDEQDFNNQRDDNDDNDNDDDSDGREYISNGDGGDGYGDGDDFHDDSMSGNSASTIDDEMDGFDCDFDFDE